MKPHRGCLQCLVVLGLAFLVGNPISAWALDPDRTVFQYNCRTWRRANGLPGNAVTAIAQSVDGRLWLGTSQGLAFFDGESFRVFDQTGQAGIESKAIASLARRSAGGLWFGLDRGSFGFFDQLGFHSLQRAEWGGPFVTIHSVQQTTPGSLLVGGTGLSGKMADPKTFLSLQPAPMADVFTIYDDGRGRIWIGTAENGLFYSENGKMRQFPDATLKGVVISAVAVDPDGKIWVGTGNGLRCYESDFRPHNLPANQSQAKALLVDRHGVLWIGSVNAGLIRCRDGVFTSLHKQDGLASERILSLAESDDGSLWVGTDDGLSQLSDVKFPILSSTEGLSHEACLAVAASPSGGIWAGTPNGLGYYRDGQFKNFGVAGADGFHSRWIKQVFAAANGDVYCIGARKNLDLLRGDRVVMSWTNDVWPRAVAEDSRGILVALAGDLMRIENDKLVPVLLADGSKVSLRWVNNLLVARDDSIWVAATEGVFQIKDGVLKNWCRLNGLLQSTFYYLCEADDGAIWGAQDAGIARFKDGGLRQITEQQGLHEKFVYSIVADKLGGFWMDSNRGIFRVDQRELNAVADGTAARVHCTVYEGEDAVKTTDKSAQDYTGCRSLDGRIWFPSSKGVIMIDPAHVPSSSPPPAVSLERVRINGQEHRLDEEPTVEPGPGNLEFDYLALDYQAPQKIQYRYRLDGYESEWVNAGNRRAAFYTNLKPGRYRFQVQASNADGVWNATGTTFALELPHRLIETAGFRIGCVLALLGLGTYVWRSQHLRRRQVQLQRTRVLLESKVRERTSELRTEIEERKRMESEVERVHRELLKVSRQAGMAEVATGVLHNVGNVLNSVNVSATLVADHVRHTKAGNIAKVSMLFDEHKSDLAAFLTGDPRGRMIPAYLGTLSEWVAAEQKILIAELDDLRKNVRHIKEVVTMQQSYARTSGVCENVPVAGLVDDALRVDAAMFDLHGIEIVREYRVRPTVATDRHKVMQILINLIRNARFACDESGRAGKRVVVRITGDGQGVRIAVIDNGVGIPAENLTRIFNHGFTTRQTGHGFGLHSGALAARELGGTLGAESDGPGRGATFTPRTSLTAGRFQP